MKKPLLYPCGQTKACRHASQALKRQGIPIADHPMPEITHLLLDVPSFRPDGRLRSGEDVQSLLSMLPQDITVAGGNLEHPALTGYNTIDLLQDAQYLAVNAAITAECALETAAPLLDVTFRDTAVLVIGWGRIGKCLARLLQSIGSRVFVAARKSSDLAMLRALGYHPVDIQGLSDILPECRVIFNTVPQLILTREKLACCPKAVKIELASIPGMEGDDIHPARGLPGLLAPETSGNLIAESFLRLYREG